MESFERASRHVLFKLLSMRMKHMDFLLDVLNLFIFYIDYITFAKTVNCLKAENCEVKNWRDLIRYGFIFEQKLTTRMLQNEQC